MTDGSFFVRSRGKVSGPFDLAGLQRLVRLGMLSRVHEVSADKQTWLPASRTPGLFPDAGAGYQPAAPEEDPQGGYEVAEIPPPPVPVPAAAVSAATMQCLSCGGIFPAAQVYLDRGRNVCVSCFQKQTAQEEKIAASGGGARGSYRGMAVASLILGICGLVILFVGVMCALYLDMRKLALGTGIVISSSCLVCAVLAVVLGAAAWRGDGRAGGGIAAAGFILGLVVAAGYLVYGAVFLAISLAAVAVAHRF